MKKLLSCVMCMLLMFSVVSACNENEGGGYDRDAGLNPQAASAFYDDFTDRDYSASLWYVGNSKWVPSYNHGVRPENVLWNDSGIVTIKSYGKYYSDPAKNYQGGVLLSKDTYGPGRYEVKMKIVPRFGACTAFWTYMYGSAPDLEGNELTDLNQEIDIELNVGNDFHNAWFTNWVTVDDSSHVEKKTEFFNSDGDWHVYTFEWHTDPMRVDYYIDDVHMYTSYSNVPYVAGAINIGNWFPDSWAGDADFEEDYMQIDYISYTPYENQPCTLPYEGQSSGAAFPAASTPLPETANMFANAGFEHTYTVAGSKTAVWNSYKDAVITDNAGRSGKGMVIEEQAVASQRVSGALEGEEYTVTAWIKLDGASAKGKVQAYFLKNSEEYIGNAVSAEISSASEGYADGQFFQIKFTFTAPAETRRVEITFETESGTMTLDDAFINLSSKL